MRILAIDYGLARTGVAISDPTGLIATPLPVIPSKNYEPLMAGIAAVLEQTKPDRVILGYPARTDGIESEMCRKARHFRQDLKDRFGVEAEFVDEKFTTVIASRQLHENGVNAKKQRNSIDSAAAAVLLQGYLDSHR